jgi:RimJ/RimL family protein N-acetyltransferase
MHPNAIMANTINITTTSHLTLVPLSETDVPALVHLCSLSQFLVRHLSQADMEHAVGQLVDWAALLRSKSGGLWVVRAGAAAIGCAMVWPRGAQRGPEIAIALEHRVWGGGYALDIAHALTQRSGAHHWTSHAESMLPPPTPNLSRITFAQLLDLPGVAFRSPVMLDMVMPHDSASRVPQGRQLLASQAGASGVERRRSQA